ncbi:hypothetical protein [Legionella pneumophila]|nr:hypothetical protein [Legionella pneumophila]MCW8401126.1 hypothetical protein [Legionella pneumophila]MCZ4698214.1 hypothetical protein [Legionella pneumophila]MCZ4713619.1 hypothetical protein [Legionella pneumophila]MCZ4744087.1 hypothetical protein [Legionella pneumophila]MCZ4764652.1 hypothetical protein [Legionella pneumophila]
MSLEKYGTYLEGLDLTEQEKKKLVEAVSVAVENIIGDLFARLDSHEETS